MLEGGGTDRPPRLRLPDVRVPRPLWWAATAIAVAVVLAVVVRTNWPSDTITGARFVAALDDGGSGIVRSVAFSPDSTTLLTGGDPRLPTLWNVADRKPIRTFDVDYRLPVSSVAFSPDGRTVAFVGGPLQLWDVTTGVQRAAPASGQAIGVTAVTGLTGHRGPVLGVAWSANGSTLASEGSDGTVRLWDVERS